MSDIIDENAVHRIVNDKLNEYDKQVTAEFAKVEAANQESVKTLQGQTSKLTNIENKLGNIYGNGSGRKCILDRIEDRQNAHDHLIQDTNNTLNDEIKKQTSFRHEIRNMFETQQLQEAAKAEVLKEIMEKKKDSHAWIKWVAGGICMIVWTLIEHYVLRIK